MSDANIITASISKSQKEFSTILVGKKSRKRSMKQFETHEFRVPLCRPEWTSVLRVTLFYRKKLL